MRSIIEPGVVSLDDKRQVLPEFVDRLVLPAILPPFRSPLNLVEQRYILGYNPNAIPLVDAIPSMRLDTIDMECRRWRTMMMMMMTVGRHQIPPGGTSRPIVEPNPDPEGDPSSIQRVE